MGGRVFAGDLLLWHWSLLLTSIAASTLEANCAPILVTLFAWLLWGERPKPAFLAATALAFGGMLLILAPEAGRRLVRTRAARGRARLWHRLLLRRLPHGGLAPARTPWHRHRHAREHRGVHGDPAAARAVAEVPAGDEPRLVAARRVRGHGAGARAGAHRLRLREAAGYIRRRRVVRAGHRGRGVCVAAARGRLAPVQILGAVVVLIAIAFARSVRRSPAAAPRNPAAA